MIYGNDKMIKRLILLFLLMTAIPSFAQYSAPPVTRIGPVDLIGGGLWNWEQRLDMNFDNYVVNGDMSYWPNGTRDRKSVV